VKLFSKISNLCDHNSPTLQTDGRTDGRTDGQTTCDRNTALCTKVHRAVKTSGTCTYTHIFARLFAEISLDVHSADCSAQVMVDKTDARSPTSDFFIGAQQLLFVYYKRSHNVLYNVLLATVAILSVTIKNKKAVLPRKQTARWRSCSFQFRVANDMHYKFKSSQSSKTRFHSSKHSHWCKTEN